MTPEDRIRQALKVIETGAMVQFNKDSEFAQSLRDLLEERGRLRKAVDTGLDWVAEAWNCSDKDSIVRNNADAAMALMKDALGGSYAED